jgi:hypothetical protein
LESAIIGSYLFGAGLLEFSFVHRSLNILSFLDVFFVQLDCQRLFYESLLGQNPSSVMVRLIGGLSQ